MRARSGSRGWTWAVESREHARGASLEGYGVAGGGGGALEERRRGDLDAGYVDRVRADTSDEGGEARREEGSPEHVTMCLQWQEKVVLKLELAILDAAEDGAPEEERQCLQDVKNMGKVIVMGLLEDEKWEKLKGWASDEESGVATVGARERGRGQKGAPGQKKEGTEREARASYDMGKQFEQRGKDDEDGAAEVEKNEDGQTYPEEQGSRTSSETSWSRLQGEKHANFKKDVERSVVEKDAAERSLVG